MPCCCNKATLTAWTVSPNNSKSLKSFKLLLRCRANNFRRSTVSFFGEDVCCCEVVTFVYFAEVDACQPSML